MRLLNACAAASGLIALVLLSYSSHGMSQLGDAAANLRLAATVLLISATAAVFASGRRWRLDVPAGALIIAGATLFTLGISLSALLNIRTFSWIAPLGGVSMMLGWIVLAFSSPRTD